MQEILVYDSDGASLSSLVQWDFDIYIYMNHPNIEEAHPVHFFNQTMDEAYVVDTSVYENEFLKVKIPNDLLTHAHPIIGYVNVQKNTQKRSLYGFKINVRKKPKPSDLVYKESNDYICITKVLEECRNFAAAASKSADDASDFALKAQSYTEGDTGLRPGEDTDSARYYYEQSLIKANMANTSAINAKTSENIASEKANNASKSEENAKRYYLLSESYCHGTDNVIRDDDSTDNSEEYCRKAKNNCDMSKAYLEKVEQAGNEAVEKINEALNMNTPSFQVDLSTGHLMYQGGRFLFRVNNSGRLEWEVTI